MEELAADFPPGAQGVAHLVLTFQPWLAEAGQDRGLVYHLSSLAC